MLTLISTEEYKFTERYSSLHLPIDFSALSPGKFGKLAAAVLQPALPSKLFCTQQDKSFLFFIIIISVIYQFILLSSCFFPSSFLSSMVVFIIVLCLLVRPKYFNYLILMFSIIFSIICSLLSFYFPSIIALYKLVPVVWSSMGRVAFSALEKPMFKDSFLTLVSFCVNLFTIAAY